MTPQFLDGVAASIVDVLKRALQPRDARIDALDKRLAALEQRPHVTFCGVWKHDHAFEPGNAVVHHGGLWICRSRTTGEPSKDFASWTLAVKRGSAG